MQEIEISPGDDTRWHEFHSIQPSLPKPAIQVELTPIQQSALIKVWNSLVVAQGGDGLDGFASKETLYNRLSILERFGVTKDNRILCVGCGEGREVMYLRSQGYSYTNGVTIGIGNVQFAKWAWDLDLIVEDMHFMTSVKSAEYNALQVYQTLEHSWAPFLALIEWNRVLSMGGVLVVEIPAADLQETQQSKKGWHHQLYLSQEQLCYLFIKAGFEVLFREGTMHVEDYKGPITVVGKKIEEI